MKVDKREIAQPKPPYEIVVTMTEEEAARMVESIRFYERGSRTFRDLKKEENSRAHLLAGLADSIGAAL